MSIYKRIHQLLKYGLDHDLLYQEDEIYVRNRIMAVLGLDEWKGTEQADDEIPPIHEILNPILDWAYEKGIIHENTITERDILEAEIMDVLMPRPSELIHEFFRLYKQSPKRATDRFYSISKSSNYIHMDRIAKNKEWKVDTAYGTIDITINLSKPEKDPKEIAKAKGMPKSNYPVCVLCKENEGYRGRLNHPARSQHRVIPVKLAGEDWFLQYSPYVYYPEHCIVFKKDHEPMNIHEKTFERLLDFVDQFPHYFIGSNADLPIVGGSILGHDHFQGGKYTFAMEEADIEQEFRISDFTDLEAGVLKWPMSVIRLRGTKDDVFHGAVHIWKSWKTYGDLEADILAFSGDVPHNTITPIARKKGDRYEMDLVLRNNRTSCEYPDGIFHPHESVHHIKKENIGLIEVMGLAVLPDAYPVSWRT